MTGKANIRDPKKRKAKQISRNSNINFNQSRGTSYKNGVAQTTSQPFLHTEGDLNMNTFDIFNLDRMLFATTSGAGDTIAVTDYGIEAIANSGSAYGLTYQIPASKIHSFKVGSVGSLVISGTNIIATVDMTTSNINLGGNRIKYSERSTPSPNPAANEGFMYSKDVSGVTTPMWLDSAGTETSLLGGGANIQLSNLGTTSVNANIIPQAGQLLGSDGNEWARVHSNSYRLGTAGTVSASSNDIIGNSSGIYFNVPSTKLFNFRVNNSSIGTISTSGTVTFPNFIISTSLNLNDATSYPGANGSIYREGNDVKIFTGGSEINMSTIGAAGANTALSNLATTTSINSNIIPQAGKLLGSSGNEWSRVHSNNYRLGTAGTSSASSNDITGTTSGITFNVATGDSFNFSVNNSSVATISTSGTATFPYTIINNSIIFNNSSSNPTTNGEFTRNGNDVKVYTGGAVKNLSDIGTGGGSSGANTTLSNLSSTTLINNSLLPGSSLSIDLGSSTKKWRYIYALQIADLGALTMDGDITMNGNDIGSVGLLTNTGSSNFAWSGGGSFQTDCAISALYSANIYLGNATDNIGFFGHSSVGKQYIPANASLSNIVAALRNLGLGS